MAKNVRVGSLAGSAKTLEKIDGSIDNNDYTHTSARTCTRARTRIRIRTFLCSYSPLLIPVFLILKINCASSAALDFKQSAFHFSGGRGVFCAMNCDCLCGGARTATFWANLDGVALMSFKTLTEEWKQGIRTDLAEEMVHRHTKLYEALAGSSLRNSFLEDIQWRRGEQMTDLSATAKTNHAQALERTYSIYTWLQAEVAQAWLVETTGSWKRREKIILMATRYL